MASFCKLMYVDNMRFISLVISQSFQKTAVLTQFDISSEGGSYIAKLRPKSRFPFSYTVIPI